METENQEKGMRGKKEQTGKKKQRQDQRGSQGIKKEARNSKFRRQNGSGPKEM